MPPTYGPGDMPMRYLPRADVMTACAQIDAVQVVRGVLELHAEGRTTLPEEAYLAWQTSARTPARCLALPGAVWDQEAALGLKVINSSVANPDRGMPPGTGSHASLRPGDSPARRAHGSRLHQRTAHRGIHGAVDRAAGGAD